MRVAALLIVALVASAGAQAQAPAPGAPQSALVREGVTEKLTQHVWAIPDSSAPLVPNVGIIAGSRAVLVVDTGMGARNGQAVMREAAKVGAGKPIFIVTTHVHPEHDLGAHAFPKDAKMIRSKDQEADIEASGMRLADVFAARSELNRQLLEGATYRPADITFEAEHTLDLGGVTARIMAMGLNHTLGDTIVVAEGVLFSGDLAMRPQPSIMAPEARISHWLATLDKLDALKPTHVVPSHGPRGDAGLISGYRVYLMQVRNRVMALKGAGQSLEQVTETVTREMSPQYPDKARLGAAIRAAWSEAG